MYASVLTSGSGKSSKLTSDQEVPYFLRKIKFLECMIQMTLGSDAFIIKFVRNLPNIRVLYVLNSLLTLTKVCDVFTKKVMNAFLCVKNTNFQLAFDDTLFYVNSFYISWKIFLIFPRILKKEKPIQERDTWLMDSNCV